jgi:hypothetical protein
VAKGRENEDFVMEIPTIVLLALITVIAGLTVVVVLAHGDMTRAVQRLDQSVEASPLANTPLIHVSGWPNR